MSEKKSNECQHGNLARMCHTCELKLEIEGLKEELEEEKGESRYWKRR
jgi:hypothetical protein